jgi:hypothetical protein
MPLTIPTAVNYQNPMNSVPALFASTPPEGARMVPIEIDWTTMGGANNCVSINLYGGAAMTLSQVVALSIDNSQCGADVQFIFPDSQQTYTIPAYEPAITLPVFTNATQMFVFSPDAADADFTRFAILNTMPPPLASPLSVEQQAVALNEVPVATGTTQLIAAGTNGVVEAIDVSFQFVSTAVNDGWQIVDGTGRVLAGGQAGASPISNDNVYIKSFAMSGLSLRYSNGLKFTQNITGDGSEALAVVNVYSRTSHV